MRGVTIALFLLCCLLPGHASAQGADGARLWRHRCGMCHGDDGAGRTRISRLYPMPDFTSHQWQRSRTEEQVRAAILGGGNGMPAFRKRLSRPEIEALVRYVRELERPPADRR